MAKIKLTKGFVALVDDEDYPRLSQFKWQHSHGYAVRHQRIKGKNTRFYMHRELIDGDELDHINRDGLDNRKVNLRAVTHQQNLLNRGIQKNNTSGHTGVYKSWKGWRAQITRNGVAKYLGSYATIQEATEVYRKNCKYS